MSTDKKIQKNSSLVPIYNEIYKKGERVHYAKYINEKGKIPLEEQMVLNATNFKGKHVLDAGCGSGVMVEAILDKGAKSVVGVDYSKEAIDRAKIEHPDKRLQFVCEDILKHTGKYDVIVSLGTLEHMDNPYQVLKQFKKQLKPGGKIILTCPNWTNPRGYMLLTLKYLFNARITLADINHLTPLEFIAWSKKLNMKLGWETFDSDWSQGDKLVKDFKKRIPNVLRDMGIVNKDEEIDKFLLWIKTHIVPTEKETKYNGALGIYIFSSLK